MANRPGFDKSCSEKTRAKAKGFDLALKRSKEIGNAARVRTFGKHREGSSNANFVHATSCYGSFSPERD